MGKEVNDKEVGMIGPLKFSDEVEEIGNPTPPRHEHTSDCFISDEGKKDDVMWCGQSEGEPVRPRGSIAGRRPGLNHVLLGYVGERYVKMTEGVSPAGVYTLRSSIQIIDLEGNHHVFRIPEGVRIQGEAKVKRGKS